MRLGNVGVGWKKFQRRCPQWCRSHSLFIVRRGKAHLIIIPRIIIICAKPHGPVSSEHQRARNDGQSNPDVSCFLLWCRNIQKLFASTQKDISPSWSAPDQTTPHLPCLYLWNCRTIYEHIVFCKRQWTAYTKTSLPNNGLPLWAQPRQTLRFRHWAIPPLAYVRRRCDGTTSLCKSV